MSLTKNDITSNLTTEIPPVNQWKFGDKGVGILLSILSGNESWPSPRLRTLR